MDSPTTNRACVMMKPMDIDVHDVGIPSLIEDSESVLVKIEVTGICGSDVKNYVHGGVGGFFATEPLILGHESSGTVIQVGTKARGVSIGDRVAIEPVIYCRKCFNCKAGRMNICQYYKQASSAPTHGTLCQYYACDADLLVKIPSTLSWEEAGCIQPLAVAVQIGIRARFSMGQTVAVFGCGPLGCMTMAVARACGVSKILAFGRSQNRVDFAKSLVADYAIPCPLKSEDQEHTPWADGFKRSALAEAGIDPLWGVDVAVELTGAESCIHAGVAFVRAGGIFVQAGFGSPIASFPTMQMILKEIDVVGSVRYNTGGFQTAINLMSSGKVDVNPFITSTFPLTQSKEALDAVRSGREMKVVIMNQL